MAIKISELTALANITSNDVIPIVDNESTTTKKVTAQQVLEYITGSTFDSLTVTSLTSSHVSGTTAQFTTISGSTVTGSTALFTTISGSTGIFAQLTASNITGTNAQFTNAQFITTTASYSLIQGDLRVLGTASIAQLTTISQSSLLVGDKYITILSGGVDHTGINGAGFLWGTSSGPGETTGALGEHAHVLYDASRDALEIFPGLYVTGSTALFDITGTTAQFTIVTGSTITGSLAKFTTLSASTAEFSGSVLIYGTASLSSNPSAAYIIYSSSMDKLVAFPGLFVSGNLTGSGLGSFQTVSASTYLGLPTSISGTTAQFTVISASLLSVTSGIFVSGSSIYGQVAELTSSTTSYTLLRQDSGKFLNINSVSATTVTVPTGLPTGFTVSLCQLNTGQVTISGAVGVTINNRQTHTKTAGQHAVVSLVGTSLDTYVFVGDTAV